MVPGFPIRTSTDRSLVGSSPWLFAASRVLLRLQAPRHPPLALCSLENKDARARYGILKGRNGRRSARQLTHTSVPGGEASGRSLDLVTASLWTADRKQISLPQNGTVRSGARTRPETGPAGHDHEGRGQQAAAGNERAPINQ